MKIVLLTYVNRSGSTYLANLLSASDDICVCPEGDMLVSLFLESPGKAFRLDHQWKAILSQIIESDRKLRSWGINTDIFPTLERADKYIDAFMAFLFYYKLKQKPEAISILFKAERLVDLFSNIERNNRNQIKIKYLHLIRDPRAVYASQKRTLFPGTNRKMSHNPVFTALYWNHFIKAKIKNQELVGSHQTIYHDLVENMEETISGLSEYLDLDLRGISPSKGDLTGRLPDGHNPIHQYISESPDSQKINQWMKELSQEEIQLIERKSKKQLIEASFELIESGKIQLAISCKVIYFTIIYHLGHLMNTCIFHLRRIFR